MHDEQDYQFEECCEAKVSESRLLKINQSQLQVRCTTHSNANRIGSIQRETGY